MSKSIRISDELLALAKAAGELQHRSPPQQIEHWAAIGQVMEPVLDWPITTETKRQHFETLLRNVSTPEGVIRSLNAIKANQAGTPN
jgi:hypothetical protein